MVKQNFSNICHIFLGLFKISTDPDEKQTWYFLKQSSLCLLATSAEHTAVMPKCTVYLKLTVYKSLSSRCKPSEFDLKRLRILPGSTSFSCLESSQYLAPKRFITCKLISIEKKKSRHQFKIILVKYFKLFQN